MKRSTAKPAGDLVTCSRCSGSGRVLLPPELQTTLDLLRKRGPLTAPMVAEALLTREHRSITSANNRLETLRGLGLVTREKASAKKWLYSLKGRP